MKDISLTTFLKNNIKDEYVMNVFYNVIKQSLVLNDYSLQGCSYLTIDGRFLGEDIRVMIKGNYRTPIHSLSFLLSVRMLMKNPNCMDLCEDDNLIFKSKPKETFQWINYMFLIMEYGDDKDVSMIYQMMEDYYYEEEFSVEKQEEFKKSILRPPYKNERQYYQLLAQKTKGVTDRIIGNNTFVDAEFDTYKISGDIMYIGNTVFAYCENLETIEFQGKTMFGKFPIIECPKLKQILVPTELVGYYKESLPYYAPIIKDKTILEHTEIKASIDYKSLYKVFEKVATSYKYFWMMAIITLAKENNRLAISYNDILIRMAAMAWPIVLENGIDLGTCDQIKKYLHEITKKTSLIQAASSKVVENYLLQHFTSQGVDKILAPLLKNVPYRFLSPWIRYTTDKEVIEKSCSKSFNGLYALHSDYIFLDEDWWDYISQHYQETCDFVNQSFIDYAKKYNNGMTLIKLMTNKIYSF